MTDLVRVAPERFRDIVAAAQTFHKPTHVPARDAGGAYVAHDGTRWKTVRDGAWTDGSAPAGPLELPVVYAELAPEPVGEQRPEAVDDPVGTDAVAGFARQVQRLRDDYHAGRWSARETAWQAQRLVLVDTDGRVWTVGLRSGGWYAWEDGGWHRADAAPDPRRLYRSVPQRRGCHACGARLDAPEDACPDCGAEAPPLLEAAPEAVQEALGAYQDRPADRMVPESVTDGWTLGAPAEPGGLPPLEPAPWPEPEPEPAQPEAVQPWPGQAPAGWQPVDCASCGADVPEGARFCPACGARQ